MKNASDLGKELSKLKKDAIVEVVHALSGVRKEHLSRLTVKEIIAQGVSAWKRAGCPPVELKFV